MSGAELGAKRMLAPGGLLFVQKALRVKAGFAPSDEDAETIRQICLMRVGPLLAIGLAATWVRILLSADIECNLDHLSSTR